MTLAAQEGPAVAPRISGRGPAEAAPDSAGLLGLGAGPRLAPPADPGGPRRLSRAGLGEFTRLVVSAEQVWRPLVRFSHEQRWFHRLALTDDCEIWLLTWLPGQSTGFHDHGEASGAFAVAQGELHETLGKAGTRRVRHRTAAAGSVTSFAGRHLHDVSNAAAEPAVSVHAYSPPLSAMRRYEMTAGGLVLVRTDRAELNW
jgi:predicted metal-dependent enzyme (double-stranded beta helix superfamily)